MHHKEMLPQFAKSLFKPELRNFTIGTTIFALGLFKKVVLMKQSSQLGAGVSLSLDQIIEEAQNVERNRVREETNRIGAKMTVIMMAFMLPALFILIGGPAVISIAEALG